jgi:hypothetical protein
VVSKSAQSCTRKLWRISDKASIEFELTETWKTSFSFTKMPDLTPACAHVRQWQKWEGLFLIYLPTDQIWRHLITVCFGSVKGKLRGRHFADENELRQCFRDELRSRGREFYSTVRQCLTQRWQKYVENDGDFVENEPHICRVVQINYVVIATIFSEKNLEALNCSAIRVNKIFAK